MVNKEDETLTELMMHEIRKGTSDFSLTEGVITDDDSFDIITLASMFRIGAIRTAEIVEDLRELIKKHNRSAADILRDIYHNMIGHEKYLAAYILGKNFKTQLKIAEMTEEEAGIFFSPINQKLDLSNLVILSDYIKNLIIQEKPGELIAYSIKKIMESDFEENDKVFLVFLYALI